jgi:short-subunit dehydrogenase
MPKVAESSIVITGASSGIGRAAALAFAERGASLALAARNEEALEEVARECRTHGARAIVVPTDVTDEAAVRALAWRAAEELGGFDVWVNGAAVTLFAEFEQAPAEAYRRVIETNLFGYVHGARAALAEFRRRGRGVLINIDSITAAAPQPYTSAYVTSKYAVRGLAECLRMELSLAHADDIHVCTVMPATIDTPLFQHAANYTGRAVQALPPVYPPEQVAQTIVELVENPQREVIIGGAGYAFAAEHALAPALYEWMGARMVDRMHLGRKPAAPTSGNLFAPMPGAGAVHGGWQRDGGTTARRAALVGLAIAIPAFVLWRSRRSASGA